MASLVEAQQLDTYPMQAHRHFYADVFPLVFSMGDTVNETVSLAAVVMEELNNRSDYRGAIIVIG